MFTKEKATVEEKAIAKEEKALAREEKAQQKEERREELREEIKEKTQENMKKAKKQSDSFWKDFKKFISKGNIVDLSVAVVIGAAFNNIVKGLVDFIITPLISLCTGGLDMTEWKQVLYTEVLEDGTVAETAIQWGSLVQAVINFLIIAMVVFLILRVYTRVEKVARETLKREEIEKKKAEEQKKKAEEEAKAKAIAERQAALKEREDRFYADVARQTAILEQIATKLGAGEEEFSLPRT